MSGTVEMIARADYGQSGQYVARITGRDAKFTFAREFVGRKTGKRKEYAEVVTDQVGLYEICDKTRKGKECRYRVAVPGPKDGELVLCKLSLSHAMELATYLDSGYDVEDCLKIETREDGYVHVSLTDPSAVDPWDYVIGETRKALQSLSPENREKFLTEHPELATLLG